LNISLKKLPMFRGAQARAERERDSATHQAIAQPQEAERKRDSAQPQEMFNVILAELHQQSVV
jgi:hypothetical protein